MPLDDLPAFIDQENGSIGLAGRPAEPSARMPPAGLLCRYDTRSDILDKLPLIGVVDYHNLLCFLARSLTPVIATGVYTNKVIFDLFLSARLV